MLELFGQWCFWGLQPATIFSYIIKN